MALVSMALSFLVSPTSSAKRLKLILNPKYLTLLPSYLHHNLFSSPSLLKLLTTPQVVFKNNFAPMDYSYSPCPYCHEEPQNGT
jgi:hypothetical protein